MNFLVLEGATRGNDEISRFIMKFYETIRFLIILKENIYIYMYYFSSYRVKVFKIQRISKKKKKKNVAKLLNYPKFFDDPLCASLYKYK